MVDLKRNTICRLIFNKQDYIIKDIWLEFTLIPGLLERQEDTKISSGHTKSNLETAQKQDHEGETLEFDGREENWLNSPEKHLLQ